jgi:hypothetical protein
MEKFCKTCVHFEISLRDKTPLQFGSCLAHPPTINGFPTVSIGSHCGEWKAPDATKESEPEAPAVKKKWGK